MEDPLGSVSFLDIALIFFLVFLNGFFVAAEFAMVKVRSTRIEQLVLEGNKRAKYAQGVTEKLDAYLSATQLGITLASLGLGWVGESTLATLVTTWAHDLHLTLSAATVHTIAAVVSFAVITFMHIVLGELAPKSLAIHRTEGTVLWTSGPLTFFYKVMYPFIWLLNGTANGFLRIIGIRPATEAELAHNEEEIRMIVTQSHESGVLDETERILFDNIFDFSNRVAREIMVPRTDMTCLYVDRSFDENMRKAETEKHTRFPLAKEDKDNIVGVVHIKDLYAVALNGNTTLSLEVIARKPVTVPESLPIKDVLRILQKNRSELAIVIDEYGGTAGIVTTEDILEELVGEIQDEFDEERPFFELHGEDLSIDARMLIDEVNEYFSLRIESEDVDTIGGWVYAQFTTPHVGAKVNVDNYQFVISEMDSLRVTRLTVKRLKSVDEEEVQHHA
ncbi:HlyC/CorC family transporter [Tumebacillus sp. ITR2]|uniref:HlyC/CorC family transporter n=1 Tax=Tumebacillus amylolyticus TaxID=2801339 RepID=A0ABS1JAE2_9BACL|nr:hemolysin family protein [Tumebacillus amylolyticus]MBL0387233.1 HlyC/CorC family transporter [Tumebacillus amylolyticus]